MQLLNTTKARLCLSFLALSCASLFGQVSTPYNCTPPNNVVVDSSLTLWFSLQLPSTAPPLDIFVANCTDNSDQEQAIVRSSYPWAASMAFQSANGFLAEYFPGNVSNWHDWIDIAPGGYSLNSSFTVGAWATYSSQNSAVNSYARIVEIGGYQAGVMLGTNAAGLSYQVIVANSNGGTQFGSCEGGTVDNLEHYVAATVSAGQINLYVDGVKVAGPCATTFSGLITPIQGRIGAALNNSYAPTGYSGQWYGNIAGFRLYGRALTAAEILEIFTAHAY